MQGWSPCQDVGFAASYNLAGKLGNVLGSSAVPGENNGASSYWASSNGGCISIMEMN
jgi:hypothetical protein